MKVVRIDFGSYNVAFLRQVQVRISHAALTQSQQVLHLISLHVSRARDETVQNKHEEKRNEWKKCAQKSFGIESVALTTTKYFHIVLCVSIAPAARIHFTISIARDQMTCVASMRTPKHRNNFIRQLLLIWLLLLLLLLLSVPPALCMLISEFMLLDSRNAAGMFYIFWAPLRFLLLIFRCVIPIVGARTLCDSFTASRSLSEIAFSPISILRRIPQDKVHCSLICHLPSFIFRGQSAFTVTVFYSCSCTSILTRLRLNSFKISDIIYCSRLVDLCWAMQHVFAWIVSMLCTLYMCWESDSLTSNRDLVHKHTLIHTHVRKLHYSSTPRYKIQMLARRGMVRALGNGHSWLRTHKQTQAHAFNG